MTRFKTNKFRLLADDLNSTTADITNTVSMGKKSNIYTNQSQCLVWQPKLASCGPSSALSTVSYTRVWFFFASSDSIGITIESRFLLCMVSQRFQEHPGSQEVTSWRMVLHVDTQFFQNYGGGGYCV